MSFIYAVAPIPIKLEASLGNDSITLVWSQPRDTWEPILNYTVYQRTDDRNDDVEDGAVVDWTKLTTIYDPALCQYSVDNLNRGEKYKFVVTATNTHGEGLKKYDVAVKVPPGKRSMEAIVTTKINTKHQHQKITFQKKNILLKT